MTQGREVNHSFIIPGDKVKRGGAWNQVTLSWLQV